MNRKLEERFHIQAPFTPTGDQPQAIAKLTAGLMEGMESQVLLGVTGSGKTFSVAHVIEKTQLPTLVISHNKTLAAQLYQEFRDFFPGNAVSYFVSYYDYYQPEAYIPHSDTYIEKETEINEEIDKLRLAATTNILTRDDSIVVASVSSIYNIGSPREYGHFVLELQLGVKIRREDIITRLIQLQYNRNDYETKRGTFRVRGESIDLYPAYEDQYIRIRLNGDFITELRHIDPLTGEPRDELKFTLIYPAKHYMTDPATYRAVFDQIRSDLDAQVRLFQSQNKLIEAQRIRERVEYDLEMISEMGYVNGIENYSRYFDGRQPGDAPYSLLDYYQEAYKDNWLLVIDESHMTIPQIRGMYNGDRSRKTTLVDFGFRLPAALDNRPLRFDEFLRRIPRTIYVSATPDDWELSRAQESASAAGMDPNIVPPNGVVEQLIRPTGLVDPIVHILPSTGQVNHVIGEIKKRIASGERVLVTTLTKRMAEDLTTFLTEKQVKVHYLHADVQTLERSDILKDLRLGTYDVVVGVNLLREGLDLPEVSLVAVLDADKEGFLRSTTSLIQTMGRAARHEHGTVILYADTFTQSMRRAVDEVERRRSIQLSYNQAHGITPQSIKKPIRSDLVEAKPDISAEAYDIPKSALESMTPKDREAAKNRITRAMRQASKELNFELAMQLRDILKSME